MRRLVPRLSRSTSRFALPRASTSSRACSAPCCEARNPARITRLLPRPSNRSTPHRSQSQSGLLGSGERTLSLEQRCQRLVENSGLQFRERLGTWAKSGAGIPPFLEGESPCERLRNGWLFWSAFAVGRVACFSMDGVAFCVLHPARCARNLRLPRYRDFSRTVRALRSAFPFPSPPHKEKQPWHFKRI